MFSVYCSFQDLCMVSSRPGRDWVGATADSLLLTCFYCITPLTILHINFCDWIIHIVISNYRASVCFMYFPHYSAHQVLWLYLAYHDKKLQDQVELAVVSLSCNCCCCHSSRCFILVSWEDKCSLVQHWIWWSADWWFHIYMSLWRNARAPQNVMLLVFIQTLHSSVNILLRNVILSRNSHLYML